MLFQYAVVKCVEIFFLTACFCRYPTESLSAAVLQLHGTLRWWPAVLCSCVWHHSPDASLWRTCQENGERPSTYLHDIRKVFWTVQVLSVCLCDRIISCAVTVSDAVSSSAVRVRRPNRPRWPRNTRRREDEARGGLKSPFLQLCRRATWQCPTH